jgi:hypothetical protein
MNIGKYYIMNNKACYLSFYILHFIKTPVMFSMFASGDKVIGSLLK